MELVALNKFLDAVEDSILEMNKFSKYIFKHSVILSAMSFLIAVILHILAITYGNYYERLITSSETMLEIFQISVGAIIISIIIEIVIKTKDT